MSTEWAGGLSETNRYCAYTGGEYAVPSIGSKRLRIGRKKDLSLKMSTSCILQLKSFAGKPLIQVVVVGFHPPNVGGDD